MTSRVEKYSKSEKDYSKSGRILRVDKNRNLYDDLNNKIGFEEIENFNTQTKIDLTVLEKSVRNSQLLQSSENEVDYIDEEQKNAELEEPKIFDINSILEDAKKNRAVEDEEIEEKRKLQNEEYNVLSDLNKKYLSKKEKKITEEEENEIKELINTINSKTLSKELLEAVEKADLGEEASDLMSDLMATNVDLNLEDGIVEEMIKTENVKTEQDAVKDKNNTQGELINSFYTKSMDLSNQDFEIRNEIEEETNRNKKIVIIVIIIILLLLIIAVGVGVLFKMGVI